MTEHTPHPPKLSTDRSGDDARQVIAHRVGAGALILGALALILTSCGGGDAGQDATPATTTIPSTTDTVTTETVTTDTVTTETSTTETSTTDTSTDVAPEEEFVTLSLSPVAAGPLTVTPNQCEIEGLDPQTDVAWENLALSPTHAFVPDDGRVAALAFEAGPACTLTLDTTVGEAGVLVPGDEIDYVAVSQDNTVIASGVFGSTVFEVPLGQSFPCDASGAVTITADGTQVATQFGLSPGEVYGLSDTTCTASGEVVLPADLVDLYYLRAHDGGYFMGGRGDDDTVYAQFVRDGVTQWRVGNPDIGEQGWIGWVHGMAPCNGGYCIVDTNTDSLIITDAAGAIRADFEITAIIGSRLYYSDLQAGPDGAVYLLVTDSADDGQGGTKELNHVIRLDVTG